MAQSCSTREVALACKLFWGILFRPDSCGWPKRAPNTRLLLYCVLQQSATRVQPRRGRWCPSTALLRLVALLRAPEGFQLSTARHSLKRRPVRRGAKDRAGRSGPSSCRPRSPWCPASAHPARCSRGSWQRPAPGCRRFPAPQSAGWRRGAEPGSRVTACLRAGARSAFPHIQSRRFRFYCKLCKAESPRFIWVFAPAVLLVLFRAPPGPQRSPPVPRPRGSEQRRVGRAERPHRPSELLGAAPRGTRGAGPARGAAAPRSSRAAWRGGRHPPGGPRRGWDFLCRRSAAARPSLLPPGPAVPASSRPLLPARTRSVMCKPQDAQQHRQEV